MFAKTFQFAYLFLWFLERQKLLFSNSGYSLYIEVLKIFPTKILLKWVTISVKINHTAENYERQFGICNDILLFEDRKNWEGTAMWLFSGLFLTLTKVTSGIILVPYVCHVTIRKCIPSFIGVQMEAQNFDGEMRIDTNPSEVFQFGNLS